MRITLFHIILCGFAAGFTWGQTPGLPPETPASQPPTLEEIRNDAEFMRIFQQMPDVLKRTQEPSVPPKIESIIDWPQQPVVPSQPASSLLTAIVAQQLAQLDGIKSVLLNDLQNAETIGYRAAKLVPNATGGYEVQTDFQSRRYVASDSKIHWAIHGDGFFVLRMLQPAETEEAMPPDIEDIYYTRAGRFELTDDNTLCLKHRGEVYLLQPEQEISSWFGNKERVEDNGVWPIIVRFDNPKTLRRVDGVLFQAEPGGENPQPTEPFTATLRSQEYEASNVDVAETLHLYRALHRMQSAMLEQLSP
jgi:flagellar basal body rod protein FlgG